MKILLLTLGSHGDVQPFVALGRGLQDSGHHVRLCTSAHFASFVREHHLEYAHMDNGFVDLVASMEGRAAIAGMQSALGTAKVMMRLLPRVKPLQIQVLQDAWIAAQTFRPDLIVFHPKLTGATDIAYELGARAVLTPLFPQYVTTRAFPAVGFAPLPLGDGYRRATYRLVHLLTRRITAGPIREWRARNGLGPRPRAIGLFTDGRGAPLPVLHGFSEVLCPRPIDWSPHAIVTGAWDLPPRAEWTPPPDLVRFLENGPPPVYFGFGSMAGPRPRRSTDIVLEAVARVGCRALLARGWGGLRTEELPRHIFAVGHVPHAWLFPRVAAVVHHGGAGTTAAAARAGRPSIVCPYFGDQPFWGARVHALGIGPRPIPQRKMSPQRLSGAIERVLTDTDLQERAGEMGARIREERGVERAVAWIEKWGK
jgi:sterol 3beta-glucosyltransferase